MWFAILHDEVFIAPAVVFCLIMSDNGARILKIYKIFGHKYVCCARPNDKRDVVCGLYHCPAVN